LNVDKEEVNLSAFLDGLKSDFSASSGKQIELKWEFATNLPDIKTDSVKLKTVLQNLIQNAIKFTEKG
jgi:signal transduction histidine kinase